MAVKGLMQSDPHDARILKAFALGLAVATRGMDHLRNRVTLEINARINDDPAFKERLYGGPVSAAPNSYEQKERAVRVCENTYAVGDSVGMCRFTTKLFNSPSLPGLEEFANQIGNVTGLQFAESELERHRPQHHGRRAPDQRPPRRPPRARHAAGSLVRRTGHRRASTPARRSIARSSTRCCRASTTSPNDCDEPRADSSGAAKWRSQSSEACSCS